jgi:hypothetical protein
MVKVTGGGRGMAAIAAHLRYISKSGRLPFEDDRGERRQGREALLRISANVTGDFGSVTALEPMLCCAGGIV